VRAKYEKITTVGMTSDNIESLIVERIKKDRVDEAELQQQAKNLELYRKDLEKTRKQIKITSSHLNGSQFGDTLQQYIDENSIDMLVMSTYKRNFLENIFNRSATKKMGYHTNIR